MNMIGVGSKIPTASGRSLRVDSFIASGGQGEAYSVTELKSNQHGVLKVFHQKFANDITLQRLDYLTGQNLHGLCPVLYPPAEILRENMIGHFCPYAEGKSLEEMLGGPSFSLLEALQLSIALAHAVSLMHRRGIAHGDLHAENIIIDRVGGVLKPFLIDFDNYTAPTVPPPPCVGHSLYMAPELRTALAQGQPALPTVPSELYSLGVIFHETLLLRHPSQGNDESEDDFNKAMLSGKWLLDPAATGNGSDKDGGGCPTTVLNADLARLFRAALSLDPGERPAAEAWMTQLGKAYNNVFCCPGCGRSCVIDISKTACPWCRQAFPALTLRVIGSGRSLKLAGGTTVIGRSELGGSGLVSMRHAVFHRIGPETRVESWGRNGTFRWDGSQWLKIPDGRGILVRAGDRLRFGDAEVYID